MNTLTIPNEILDLTEEERAQLAELENPDADVARRTVVITDGDQPCLDAAPEHGGGMTFSPELQRQIVAMIVTGQERDYLNLIKPDHFAWEAHRLIVATARDLRATCGGMPEAAAFIHELRGRLREKPDAIKADYIGEYGTCRQFYTPGIVDENYLRELVVSFVGNQEVLKKLFSAREEIKKTGKLNIADFRGELAKLERIAAGGGGATRSFVDANEVLSWPDPKWLIEGILIENAFGMIYGLPGCMKTFLALDMALSLAHGLKFLGRFDVTGEVPVAYITPEGTAGLKSRLQAWMKGRGVDRLRNVVINRHAFRLNEPEEAAAVVEQVLASGVTPKVLFVDTLARNFGGGDENSTKDMNSFVNNVMEIVAGLGVAVVVVHHSGKDTAKGARGSIALTGGVDFSIEMEKPESGRAVVRCRKQKEAAEFPAFDVHAVPVGPSLTLEYIGEAKAEPKGKRGDVATEDVIPVIKHCQEPKTLAELVAACEMSRATVERHVYLARNHGLVEKQPGHRWALTVAGMTKVQPQSLISLK